LNPKNKPENTVVMEKLERTMNNDTDYIMGEDSNGYENKIRNLIRKYRVYGTKIK
jgi:hypothetical protein